MSRQYRADAVWPRPRDIYIDEPPAGHALGDGLSGLRVTPQLTPPPGSCESASRAPARFGRYERIGRIARGGMATVYLCQLVAPGGFRRLFAVKLIHPHLAEDQEFIRMVRQEARIASQIHHPNAVGIVDIGRYDESPYLVMDYIEGCSFNELLRRQPRERRPRVILPIFIDAMRGLEAVHRLTDDHGNRIALAHRDFSPHNMLVGLDGVCRVSDFGVAKGAGAPSKTQPGTAKGKPAYMSPEQILGDDVGVRSDIFSAGIVLWNAITGHRLFHGNTPAATMFNVLRRKIPRPSTVGLCPPQCLDAICLKALARDPSARFASAQEMLDSIQEAASPRGFLGSASEVSDCVRRHFGKDIEHRRQLVREHPVVARQQARTAKVSAAVAQACPTPTSSTDGLLAVDPLAMTRRMSQTGQTTRITGLHFRPRATRLRAWLRAPWIPALALGLGILAALPFVPGPWRSLIRAALSLVP